MFTIRLVEDWSGPLRWSGGVSKHTVVSITSESDSQNSDEEWQDNFGFIEEEARVDS